MDNYYPRHCAERLARLAAGFPAVVVTGARQAGKTTLLRRAFPEHHYVSLDLPSVADQAERNPDLFLRNHPPPVLVDEVQYAPGLFRHLKAAIDVRRHEMGRFVLTGSQHFTLMKGVSESLAGRCGLLELENLALAEIGGVTEVPSDAHGLAALMSRGQFPELWRLRELSERDYFSSYLATYLERDVRQILRVGSLRDFERFLRVLAARPAAMLNRSDVARDVGITGKTVGEWLSVLETSGQIALLEPWYANFGKRLVKTPKVYFPRHRPALLPAQPRRRGTPRFAPARPRMGDLRVRRDAQTERGHAGGPSDSGTTGTSGGAKPTSCSNPRGS